VRDDLRRIPVALVRHLAHADPPPQTVLNWVRKAQVDAGQRAGVSTAEAAELRRLRAEVKQLRLANDILKTASAFFAAAELDRRLG
jgi:transposase